MSRWYQVRNSARIGDAGRRPQLPAGEGVASTVILGRRCHEATRPTGGRQLLEAALAARVSKVSLMGEEKAPSW